MFAKVLMKSLVILSFFYLYKGVGLDQKLGQEFWVERKVGAEQAFQVTVKKIYI